MEAAVTTPVERSCGQIAHVARMHGYSLPERSLVTVELERGADLDGSMRLLQEALRGAGPLLPQEALPPAVTRADRRVFARYAAQSDVLPLVELGEVVQEAFVLPVARTSGVGLVASCGERRRQVTVDVDPVALAGVGLTLREVVEVLTKAGAGTPDALAPLVLRYANGAPVRLQDVARVWADASMPDCVAYDERGPVVETLVRTQPGAHADEIRKAIAEREHAAATSLPPGVVLRARTFARTLEVDLDPDVVLAVRIELQRAIAGVAGIGSFLLEIGPTTEADPPTIARVLLASKDDALAARVLTALRALPFVRSAGEPNATVELSAVGRSELEAASAELFRALAARGELVLRLGVDRHPEARVLVDAGAASRLGVSRADVELALAARKGKVVSTYFTATGSVAVVLHVGGTLDHLYAKGLAGPVPLDAVTSTRAESTPLVLQHVGQFPMVGARVQTKDLSGLRRAYVPPPDVHLQVLAD